MTKRMTGVVALLGAALPLLGSLVATSGVLAAQATSWSGTVRAGGAQVGLRLRLGTENDPPRFTVPHFGWYDLPARVREDADRLSVELDVYGEVARMELERREAALDGTWDGWGATGSVRLEPSGDARLARIAEELDFESDGHLLHGTLLMPAGEGPFPAIVWTHGSGRITREDPIYRSLAAWVVEHGIASLVYDKRPPEPGATMQVLGADAVAGVEAVRADPRILPEYVGVGGMSQGGWISPIAASLSEYVGFVVGLSAPGISPGEQNLFNQYNKVLNAGFPAADAEEAGRILRRIYGYLRTGKEHDEVWRELELSREHPWFTAAYELPIWYRRGLPPAPWEHRDALDFDPAPLWRAIEQPVICLWGAEDDVIPGEPSRAQIDGWLAEAGSAMRELRVLPGASHDLRLPPRAPWTMGAVPAGANVLPRFVRSLVTPRIEPPPTRRGDELDTRAGIEHPDPYAWLERGQPEVREWAQAQDELTARRFADDPLVAQMYERMIELNRFARAPVPRVAGGLSFIDGQYPGEFVSDVRVRGANGDEAWRVLVDPKNHPASPDAEMALGPPIPSPDGRYVLYGASSASVPDGLRVVEVESGGHLADDTVHVRYWPWLVSWMADSSGFLYVAGNAVRLHRLGTSPADDPFLFRLEETPPPDLAVRASADGTHVFVTAFYPGDDTARIFAHELGADTASADPSWRELVADVPGAHQVVGKREERVFLYTTVEAPRGRIVAVDLDRPESSWSEVVPEYPEPVYDDNHPIRPTVGLFGDRLASLYPREGRMLLRVHDLDGNLTHELEHDTFGFTESGLVGRPDQAVVRYDYASIFDRGTAYEVDLHSGVRTQLGTPVVPFDPDEFVLTREIYRSFDGTDVPIFLAHRKRLVRDGTHPVLLINWALSGLVVRPLYMPSYQAWLELGGVLALPAARGGGEHGEDWHRAGQGRNKETALDDLGAAADWLAASGISRADRIAMFGSSMSGAASAGAFVRHRDSFGAGLFQIPRIDLLASRGWWTEEYGDPDDEGDLRAMLAWLPLQNAQSGWYPSALVQVGSEDTVAPAFHGYKLVAALQAAQRGSAPTFLQVVWGAGHSQGTGVPQRSATLALQFAFLARELGLGRAD